MKHDAIQASDIIVGARYNIGSDVFTVTAIDEYRDGVKRVHTKREDTGSVFSDTVDDLVSFLNEENATRLADEG